MVKFTFATIFVFAAISVCVSAMPTFDKFQCVTDRLRSDFGESFTRYYDAMNEPDNIRKTRLALFKAWVEHDMIALDNDGDLVVGIEGYDSFAQQMGGNSVGVAMASCRQRKDDNDDVFDNASDGMDCLLDQLGMTC